MAHTCNLSTQRLKQEDHCEFEASLDHIVSFFYLFCLFGLVWLFIFRAVFVLRRLQKEDMGTLNCRALLPLGRWNPMGSVQGRPQSHNKQSTENSDFYTNHYYGPYFPLFLTHKHLTTDWLHWENEEVIQKVVWGIGVTTHVHTNTKINSAFKRTGEGVLADKSGCPASLMAWVQGPEPMVEGEKWLPQVSMACGHLHLHTHQ